MNKEAEYRLTEQQNMKEIVNLKSSLSVSESSLVDLKAANEVLEGIFKKQNASNTELSDEIAVGQETKGRLEERIGELEEQVEGLTGDVESFSLTIEKLKGECLGLQSNDESRDDELKSVGEELAEKSMALVAAERESSKFESLCGSLKSEIEVQTSCLDQKRETIRKFEDSIDQLENEVKAASEVNVDLTSQLACQTQFVETIQKKHADMDRDIQKKQEDMDRENEKAMRILEGSQDELRDSKVLVGEQETTINSLKSENKKIRVEMSELTDSATATELMLHIKSSEVRKVGSDLGVAERKADILGSENVQLSGRLKDLDERFKVLSLDLERAVKSENVIKRENAGLGERIVGKDKIIEVSNPCL
jgi:chromosome segregation ATPase